MTITEDLQFSVLTAPIAQLDRRTLSQAWYSALYGAQQPSKQHPVAKKTGSSRPAAPTISYAPADRSPRPRKSNPIAAERHTRLQPGAAIVERRSVRSDLARKIERVFLRPNSAGKASFELSGAAGRVQVLLHTSGTRMKLVAICPPRAGAMVSAALMQARYALAARGIDLGVETRESSSR